MNICQLTSVPTLSMWPAFLPQAFYYFYAYAQLKRAGKADNAVICVPSGNFGNITAGLFGKEDGVACEAFYRCQQPATIFSINICKRANTIPVRLLQQLLTPWTWEILATLPVYLILYNGSHAAISAEISGTTYTDEQIRETVKETWKEHHYLLDPHGACGYRALVEGLQEGETGVFLETAHPAKFLETVESIIGESVEIPAKLQEFMKGEKKSLQMTKEFADFKSYLLSL